MMNFLSKWETVLAHGNFTGLFDQGELLNEIFETQNLKSPKSEIDNNNLFDNKELVQLEEFKNKVILPSFKEYAKDVWKYRFWEKHEFELKAWLSSAKEGYFHPFHNHRDAHLGACFYLMVSDDQGGKISFYDPRFNFNRGYSFLGESDAFKPQTFQPRTGDYIVFPSSVYHEVSHFKGGLRVALIVDLYITD